MLNMLSQSQQRAREAAAVPEAPQSMFQFFGPDLRSVFWKDPKTAGQVLILQGELMMKMGEILIHQGRGMLDGPDGAGATQVPAVP
jgi:hypothetical protein